jgi:hypothetical protein
LRPRRALCGILPSRSSHGHTAKELIIWLISVNMPTSTIPCGRVLTRECDVHGHRREGYHTGLGQANTPIGTPEYGGGETTEQRAEARAEKGQHIKSRSDRRITEH